MHMSSPERFQIWPPSLRAAAKKIVQNVIASMRDGDALCEFMQAIAMAKAGHEEDTVYKALNRSELPVRVALTMLGLGHLSLRKFPCLARNQIETAASRGQIQRVLGMPWQDRYLVGHVTF